MPRKFKIVEGFHFEKNPNWNATDPSAGDRWTKRSKGEVVESDTDLAAKFVNKFEEIRPDPRREVTPERQRAVRDLIAASDWGDEDKDFLESVPDDNFERLVRNSRGKPNLPADQAQAQRQQDEKGPVKVTSHLGEDVTDAFPKAKEANLLVFRSPTGKHQIVKADNPGKTLNPQPLEGNQVDRTVERLVKEK